MNRTVRTVVAIATAGITIGLAACGGSDAKSGDSSSPTVPTTPTSTPATVKDKSGNSAATVLHVNLANENDPPAGEAPGIQEFARRVDELSNGAIAIDIHWRARETDDVFTKVTQAVRNGTADIAFVGNNYWGYEGVQTTRAAQAPLLIRSFAQAVAVAEDPHLATDLMSGLGDIGVVGLQMFPEDFKVLINFEDPSVGLGGLDGRTVQGRASPEVYAFFETLGATPQQNEPKVAQLRLGPPWLQREFVQGAVVGDMPIHFTYFDLVANEDFWNGLDYTTRDVLTRAAAASQDWVVAQQTERKSLDYIADYCSRGSAVIALDDATRADFEAAAAKVTEELRTDSTTSELIDRIAALGEGRAPTVYPVCTHDDGPQVDFPEGTYRFEVGDDELQAAGVDPDDWAADSGVYTVIVKAGTYSWTQQSDTGVELAPGTGGFEGGGTYTVTGNRLTMTETKLDPNGPVPIELLWSVDEHGTVSFKIVSTNRVFPRILFGEPWIRIGDA